MSIQNTITLLASACLIAVVGLLAGLSLEQQRSDAQTLLDTSSELLRDAARDNLQAEGQAQALHIQQRFGQAYEFAQGIARQVLHLRGQTRTDLASSRALRQDLAQVLRAAIAERRDLLGLFVAFDQNALDGRDAAFIDQPDLGSNDSGRFTLYWLQPQPGQLQAVPGNEALLANDTPGPTGAPFNAFFTCSRQSAQPCVLEPYLDDSSGIPHLVTSVTVPLIVDGRVIGVVGLDIGLDALQDNAKAASGALYDGHGSLSIYSASGVVAADSAHPQRLGKASTGQATPDETLLGVQVPIEPIAGAQPWNIQVTVPRPVLDVPVLRMQQQVQAQQVRSLAMELTLGLLLAAAGIAMMAWAARSVTRPIQRVAALLDEIADGDGDLTRRLAYPRRNELGRLSAAFDRFLDRLQPVIAQVQQAVHDTQNSADQSQRIASQTSQGMQQQVGEIEQMATAVHEMSATAQAAAHSAAQAADAARHAEHATGNGVQVIEQSTQGIRELASGMSDAMQRLQSLAASSEQIGSVLDVILAIARQTNLLALNAAIEAARAGDAGRGFAVVADEVRGLAQRTQASVEEIGAVIDNLREGTRDVTAAMQRSNSQAHHNVEQTQQALAVLEEIRLAVGVITDMNVQIACAAEEQSAVAEEIHRNVEAVRNVVCTVSGQAEQSSAISQRLNGLAVVQQGLIQRFKA
ncbi:MAG: methyl-accepting chemotaxis protein [Candidatus Pseudomonas phytovorans]|uniref:Methyl-accepting chemotaxis protein n=1 Tax=Candidatus Pseudomonas phytovorans TaxID=3121377 RepID=A0AAJ5WBX3_9PSED|nr:methyl-accepting chemotaxis protein [Pseudomonas sp.]WEK28871.1 MAG: methyl-accepting chemotaxis protein [Pseudomonas sp.]